MATVLVANADRMVTQARSGKDGIELKFADGAEGLIPFSDIPEIGEASKLASIEIPNPYLIALTSRAGDVAEVPWDFGRHYCDASYRQRVEGLAASGRQSIGERIRALRDEAGMTQQALASAAGIGRVTLVRIERGEQSPRYDTLAGLAKALDRSVADLVP
jgi:DNA-binding XRE family transcriptional regulator